MKRAELNQIVRYKGELCEVVALGDGRTVYLRAVNAQPCPHCGRTDNPPALLEDSPLFQDNVEPVATIVESSASQPNVVRLGQ